MMPIRMISNMLGMEASFDSASRTAQFVHNSNGASHVIQLTLGKNTMIVDGKEIPLRTALLNVDGRILIPMSDLQRALAEAGMDVKLGWEDDTKTLTVN